MNIFQKVAFLIVSCMCFCMTFTYAALPDPSFTEIEVNAKIANIQAGSNVGDAIKTAVS